MAPLILTPCLQARLAFILFFFCLSQIYRYSLFLDVISTRFLCDPILRLAQINLGPSLAQRPTTDRPHQPRLRGTQIPLLHICSPTSFDPTLTTLARLDLDHWPVSSRRSIPSYYLIPYGFAPRVLIFTSSPPKAKSSPLL